MKYGADDDAAGPPGRRTPGPLWGPWYLIAGALGAAGLFHVGVQLVRGGPLTGPVSWREPADFGLSFGALLAVLTWLSPALALGQVARPVWLSALAAVCVVEEVGVAVQAWRGVPSHFNTSTPTNSAVAMSLAVGGLLLVAVLLTGTVAAFRPAVAQAGPGPGEWPARLALRCGLVLTDIGLVLGALMIARGMTWVRAGAAARAYAEAGWLRPAHGLALAGVLVLPLADRLVARVAPRRRTRLTPTLVGLYPLAVAAVTAALLIQWPR
jgi:hypothetical protein